MRTEKWSETELLAKFGHCENLSDLINEVESFYLKEQQLVCEIRINGMLLDEEDEKRFAETPLSDVRELSVSLSHLSDLLRDVQSAFKECIPSLQETILKCSEYFRLGEHEKAQNLFSATLEGCQWLVDTIHHVRKATSHASGEIFPVAKWTAVEKEFTQSLRQILLSFQSRDYALLADVLEYELTTILDSWLALIDESEAVGVGEVEIGEAAPQLQDTHDADIISYDSSESLQEEPMQDTMGR